MYIFIEIIINDLFFIELAGTIEKKYQSLCQKLDWSENWYNSSRHILIYLESIIFPNGEVTFK